MSPRSTACMGGLQALGFRPCCSRCKLWCVRGGTAACSRLPSCSSHAPMLSVASRSLAAQSIEGFYHKELIGGSDSLDSLTRWLSSHPTLILNRLERGAIDVLSRRLPTDRHSADIAPVWASCMELLREGEQGHGTGLHARGC